MNWLDNLIRQLQRIATASILALGTLFTGIGGAHAATTLTLTIDTGPAPSVVGQPVGIFVESNIIPYTYGTTPNITGTVTLYDGTTQIGQNPASFGYGSGSNVAMASYFNTSFTSTGAHNLRAVYSGDSNYSESADALYTQQVVASAPSTNTYTTGTQVSQFDYNSSFGLGDFVVPYGAPTEEVVTTYSNGAPALPPLNIPLGAPTGNETLLIDGSPATTTALSGPYGFTSDVVMPVPLEPIGTHTATASYPGDTTFANMSFSSSVSIPSQGQNNDQFTVVASPTATLLTASATGNSAHLNATVYPHFTQSNGSGFDGCSLAPITGTINFMEGSNVIATGTLNDSTYSGGSVTCHYGSLSGISATLPAGPHTITANYQGDGNFLASVSDSQSVTTSGTPITLNLPGSITVNATSSSGANVNYSVSTSGGSGSLSVICNPPSGSQFAIGTTTVSCSASDLFGDSTSGSFDVTVVGALPQAQGLLTASTGVGTGKSLAGKASTIIADLSATPPNVADACSTLGAYLNEVSAQTGKSLTTTQAQALTNQAKQIEAVLGCP